MAAELPRMGHLRTSASDVETEVGAHAHFLHRLVRFFPVPAS